MFADIAGFTAWASTREPIQVFKLLEHIYGSLDKVTKRRGIFKVETIGDCYVAVAGMPEPRDDHAVAMARFARIAMSTIVETCQHLELSLGPDTADLTFRIGLHSGAVTGGVIRGENARFQLFGDTMNTAARIESTGSRGAIHISKATADLLIEADKVAWVKPRPERVVAKGKGELETFWLVLDPEADYSLKKAADAFKISISPTHTGGSTEDQHRSGALTRTPSSVVLSMAMEDRAGHELVLSTKNSRLVAWNAAVLLVRLKHVVAQRKGDCPNPETLELGPTIEAQLNQYITAIFGMYRDNEFHNFEHANHVTMSVTKLLSRVVNPGHKSSDYIADITSNPLAQFALCFSALIHDVDHTGVPNTQLVNEEAPLATRYKNQSVAENNSIAIAWELFLQPDFEDLLRCLCPKRDDLDRFQELVINAVLATDIVDKNLKEDRNARWAKVFSEGPVNGTTNHLKSRIVLEHMIQASDVCHTMQHWHVYRKWNERFFVECYKAYKEGRAEKNPVDTWYHGEIGFFDYYIIPLAQKLFECGCFGVSSDEYLKYALQNRHEWEIKGREVISEYVEKYCD
jgi:class 3 adenylate cyclase